MQPLTAWIPAPWKLTLRLTQRYLTDRWTGTTPRLAQRTSHPQPPWPAQLSLTQPLKPTAYAENKRHNLTLGIQSLETVTIAPGQIFSFWHLIGQPSQRRGYRAGRAIVNNQLQAEIGGGLCQLSGMLYQLALQAGLTIHERHAHSQDIYTDETRFAPLGSDATVVYGYKDLRFENTLDVPLRFQFHLAKAHITTTLCSPQPIECYAIEFLIEDLPHGRQVQTLRHAPNQPPCLLQTSFYRVDPSLHPSRNPTTPQTSR